MAEYIVQDALSDFKDDLVSEFIELCRGNDYNKLSLLKIGDTIDDIYDKHIEKHSTADVVEIVRCKDCKYWGGVTFGYICRRFSGTTLRNETRETDYCSFGAKMDGKCEGE